MSKKKAAKSVPPPPPPAKVKTVKTTPKVWASTMINHALLQLDPANTQKQDRKTFNELKKNIMEQGFDENLIVTRNKDGTYTIRSGNHRFQAGKAAGMEEFPCVVRDDWDEVQASLQSVRRNYARGNIDKAAFTALVNELQKDYSVSVEDIYGGMGFSDADAFALYYEAEQKIVEEVAKAERQANDHAAKLKIMDELGMVLNHIFEEYGDTVHCSFIVFPAAGKNHMFVQANNSLKTVLTKICERCLETGLDVNTALAGLLQIGVSNTDFLKKGTEQVKDSAASAETDPEDTDIEPIHHDPLDS